MAVTVTGGGIAISTKGFHVPPLAAGLGCWHIYHARKSEVLCRFYVAQSLFKCVIIFHAAGPSWEANSSLATQKLFPRILCNPKVHYCVHEQPANFSFPGKDEYCQRLSTLYLQYPFNIIIPSMPRSSKWMLNNSDDGLYSELLSLWTFSIVRCKMSINALILIVKVVSLLQVSPTKPCTHLPSPHTCHTLRPSNPPWRNHTNIIWWGVQTIKRLTEIFSNPPVASDYS